MNISGIRPSAGFYDYNTGKSEELCAEKIQELSVQQPFYETEISSESISLSEEMQVYQKADFADYAGQYQQKIVCERKETDSDVSSLDIEKAISDMKRDQVLQQYQFFVRESRAQQLIESRMQENFWLQQ